MSEGSASYVSAELQKSEKLISFITEPDLPARRRILVAIFPLIVSVVIVGLVVFNDGQQLLAGAAVVYLAIAFLIWARRLCRTSYVISTRRVVRFVGGKKVEDVTLAEIGKPVLLDYAASDFFLARWIARFLSLGPGVEIRRLKPEPWTVTAFFTSRDLSRMRIGYPGHSLFIAKIFDDVTLAWEAAQDGPVGGDESPDRQRSAKAAQQALHRETTSRVKAAP